MEEDLHASEFMQSKSMFKGQLYFIAFFSDSSGKQGDGMHSKTPKNCCHWFSLCCTHLI